MNCTPLAAKFAVHGFENGVRLLLRNRAQLERRALMAAKQAHDDDKGDGECTVLLNNGRHCAGTLRALQVARAAVSATRFLILF